MTTLQITKFADGFLRLHDALAAPLDAWRDDDSDETFESSDAAASLAMTGLHAAALKLVEWQAMEAFAADASLQAEAQKLAGIDHAGADPEIQMAQWIADRSTQRDFVANAVSLACMLTGRDAETRAIDAAELCRLGIAGAIEHLHRRNPAD